MDPPEDARDENKTDYVQRAINEAVDKMDNGLPLMMQLCKIKEATCKAENMFDTRAAEKGGTSAKGQTADPRKPKEVLIEQGISPNPGPLKTRAKAGKRRMLASLMTCLINKAESRHLAAHYDDTAVPEHICVGWPLVGKAERSGTDKEYDRRAHGISRTQDTSTCLARSYLDLTRYQEAKKEQRQDACTCFAGSYLDLARYQATKKSQRHDASACLAGSYLDLARYQATKCSQKKVREVTTDGR